MDHHQAEARPRVGRVWKIAAAIVIAAALTAGFVFLELAMGFQTLDDDMCSTIGNNGETGSGRGSILPPGVICAMDQDTCEGDPPLPEPCIVGARREIFVPLTASDWSLFISWAILATMFTGAMCTLAWLGVRRWRRRGE